MATRGGMEMAQEARDARYREYLNLLDQAGGMDFGLGIPREQYENTVNRLKALYGEFGLPEGFIPSGMGGQLFNILDIESPSPRVGIGDDIRVLDRDGNVVRGGTNDYPFVDDNNNPLILSPTGVVTGNPTVGSTEGGDGPPGTITDRLNYGTGNNGINTLSGLLKDTIKSKRPPMTTATTTPTPANNEGIQTLTNTYVPPTNIDQQAADQVMKAGQTNVAAQNLASQQAATYADMFKPRTTTEDTSDVGTGGDDATGGTDTSGTGGTTNTDGGATVSVGGTTNTGLNTQDLINDYLQTQGININDLNNPAIDYYNIGNLGFDPFNVNNFINPMNNIDFSSLPAGTEPLGFAPVGIATLGR